jgi:hypothetical protein
MKSSRSLDVLLAVTVAAILAALAGVQITPAADRSQGVVQLAVTADVDAIRVNDPLLVKVALTNGSKRPVVMSLPFTSGFGTVRFEIKNGADQQYAPVRAIRSGLDCGFGPFPEAEIAPSTSIVSYEWLFDWKSSFVFPKAGRYHLRSVVKCSDVTYYSDPITITVTERRDKENDLIEANARGLEVTLLAFGLGGKDESDLLARIKPKLGESNLLRTLHLISPLHALRAASTARQYDESLSAISQLRGGLSVADREYLDLALARTHLVLARDYYSRKDLLAAEKLLASAGERSVEKEGLMALLSEIKNRKR